MSQDNVNDASPGQATAVQSPAPPEHRPQLRRRIEGRIAELEASRTHLAAQAGKVINRDRAEAIESALQVARSAMSGGWEHVGQTQAAQLSQWLTNTAMLVVAAPTPQE